MKKQNQQEQYNDLRIEHYLRVYENARFSDWNRYHLCLDSLEEAVLAYFPENRPLMKLVGSSATRTMRRGEEDLDFAVAFQNPISNEKFLNRIRETGLDITDVNQDPKYGYIKISGKHRGMDFVLVPMRNPNGSIQTYEQDAFYHPDFINNLKREYHSFNAILAKEFFSQLGTYKEVKGIGSELLILRYGNFDDMLRAFAENDSLRINFSQNNSHYSANPLIVDYPFLGERSFTEKVNSDIYSSIQDFARNILENPMYFTGSKK